MLELGRPAVVGGGYFAAAARPLSLMNPHGSRAGAPRPSLDRLKRGAQDTLQRLHQLQDVTLETGDREAARGVGAVIAQVRDLDQRISEICLQ